MKSQLPKSLGILLGLISVLKVCASAAGTGTASTLSTPTPPKEKTAKPFLPEVASDDSLEQDEVTELLSSLDYDVFGSGKTSQEKYKRAISELDSLLSTLIAEINEQKATKKKGSASRRQKRGIGGGYGGGGGGGYGGGGYGGGDDGGGGYGGGNDEGHYGWGQQQQESYGGGGGGHGWQVQHHVQHVPVPHYKIHHHHHGINPEFLLKTALILKGILVLGHVAAMG